MLDIDFYFQTFPPHFIESLPILSPKRISKLSSNKQVFNQKSNLYDEGFWQKEGEKYNLLLSSWNDVLATNVVRGFLELNYSCAKNVELIIHEPLLENQ